MLSLDSLFPLWPKLGHRYRLLGTYIAAFSQLLQQDHWRQKSNPDGEQNPLTLLIPGTSHISYQLTKLLQYLVIAKNKSFLCHFDPTKQ